MTSITERAMLATLHISAWGGMMIDQEVTDAANEDFKAEKDAGRYNKRLVKPSFLSGVTTAHNNVRKVHRLMTLPWEDDGTRILSMAAFMQYQQKMKEAKAKVETEVKAFLADSSGYIREAQTRLGNMFDIGDYPDADTLKSKFSLDVEIKPLPQATDFRVKLSDDNTKAIVKDIERRTNDRLNNAVKDVFSRVEVMVKAMSTKLKDYKPPSDGNRAQGIIRDTLIYNINELADFMPILNVTDDPRINDLAKQLKAELVEHSPEILRADESVRNATVKKADAILKKLQGYMK